jgi:hypothetical protein
MQPDTTYSMRPETAPARVLSQAGQWDHALAVLPAEATALRAQILTERFWWRLDDPAEAEAAIAALAKEDPVLARFCDAQLAYTRIVFGFGARPSDAARARDGFTIAAADDRLAGWGSFWLGVLADNVDAAPGSAMAAYTLAMTWARQHEDLMLESYAARHLGDHALESGDTSGLDLLRTSYYLRAALGARPQTAAAALTLSAVLPQGAEADQLHRTAAVTARELRLTWLLNQL